MIKKTLSTLIVLGMLASFLPSSLPNRAEASDRSTNEFMAGQYYNNIIPDYDFVDVNSLSQGDIQSFLENHNSNLKSYVDNSTVGGGRSAAQIIYEAAHGIKRTVGPYDTWLGETYNGISLNTSTGTVSPKVLLVFLEKEQGLINNGTDSYDIAMGYGCPDSGGCSANYRGFGQQVEWAAWQLRYNYEYALRGTKPGGAAEHYVRGESDTMHDWNGDHGVTMGNGATASIYSYTPHVFDSAYNFWAIFYRWFSTAALPSSSPPPYDGSGIQVFYRTHVQNIGWTDWKGNGQLSGTSGQGLRIEAMQMQLMGAPEGVNFEFRAHIQNRGWSDWSSNGSIIGTTGLGLRIEAFEARIINSSTIHVYYQTHVQNYGWMAAVRDGETSGTSGQGLRVESMKMEVNQDGNTNPLLIGINTRAHIQNVGWTSWIGQDNVIGTVGRGLRIEALQIALSNAPAGTSLRYRVHVQNVGWMDWVAEGQTAGTEGRSLRIEALEIEVQGPQTLHVCYDGHIQNIGWRYQYCDGQTLGTTGSGLRLEALTLSIR